MMMEQLPINDGSGQSFGFVLYRKHISHPHKLTFPGTVRDRAVVSQLCGGYCGIKDTDLGTCYSAAYMSQTQDQQCFTISEVAADWH